MKVSVGECIQIKLFFGGVLFFLSGITFLQGQNREASLYSAYGLGLKTNFSGGAHISAMGGGGFAYSHSRELNINNPASYASLSYVNYEIGLALDYREFFTEEGFGTRVAGYLNQLALAFPYKSMFTLVLGLRPLYRIGYEVNDGGTDNQYTYYGSGDISQAYFALASTWDKLKVGVSASYIFGSTSKAALHNATETQYSLVKQQNGSIQSGGYRVGIQYDVFRSDESTLGLGLVFAGTYAGSYSGEELLRSLSSAAIVASSVSLGEVNHRAITLPMEVGFGLMYRLKDVWSFVGDYRFSNAHIIEEIGLIGEKGGYTYADDHRFSMGAGYTPEVTAFGNYLNMISYKVGGYFEKMPLIVDGNSLYSYGFTVGTTLPILSKLSMANIHLSYSFGILESTDKSLPSEYTYSFLLNLSFFDTWFAEYKYD